MKLGHVPLWLRPKASPNGQRAEYDGMSLREPERHVPLESSVLQRFCLLS
jgi:hypothetical protein